MVPFAPLFFLCYAYTLVPLMYLQVCHEPGLQVVGGGGRSADQTHQSAARSRSLAGSARQKGIPSLADPSGDIHGQPETAGKESDRQETRRAFC